MSDFLNPLSSAICQFIFTYLLHSSFLLAGCWCLLRCVKTEDHVLRDYIWRGSMLLGVITALVSLTLPPGQRLLLTSRSAANHPSERSDSQNKEAASEIGRTAIDNSSKAVSAASAQSAEREFDRTQTFAANSSLPQSILSERASQASKSIAAGERWSISIRRWRAAWCLPMAVLFSVYWCATLMCLVWQWKRVQRGLSVTRRCERTEKLLCHIGKQSGWARLPAVQITCHGAQPFAFGLLQRKIVVPQPVLDGCSDAELRALLAHECGHIAYRHTMWLLCLTSICRLFPIQPLNFVARRLWREEAELVADDWAIKSGSRRVDLATSLTKLAQTHRLAHWLADTGFSLGASTCSPPQLVRRVERLLQQDHFVSTSQGDPQRSKIFAMALFALCAFVLEICSPCLAAETDPPAQSDIALERAIAAIEAELLYLDKDWEELLATSSSDKTRTQTLEQLIQKQSELRRRWNNCKSILAKEMRL